jgi:subtilisin-like proprotein convertase family protein
MKNQIILSGMLVVALAGTASATIVVNDDWSVGETIADNSPAGMTVSQTFTGLDTGLGGAGINEVDVRLNISGGYNGDLYGYLTYNGQTVVLLNRVAGATGGTYGSSASGFGTGTFGTGNSITLSDAGGDGAIHTVTGSPVAVGNYTPDADGGTFAAAFNNADPNGTWTLFLADLSGGDQSSLVSWGLNISVVPEPVTYALGIFGGVLGLTVLGRRMRKAQE